MKKQLLLAALAFMAFPAMAADSGNEPVEQLMPQNRSEWVITGCGQRGASNDSDGGFAEMFDDNNSTFWHSEWDSDANMPHFFIVNRGTSAKDSGIDGFGYMPRQGATTGNGYVTKYRVYVLNDVSNISVCEPNDKGSFKADSHTTLTSALENLTPAAEGTFNIQYNNTSTHTLQKVEFENRQYGQYVVFVADETSGSAGSKHANCAEFYLYDIKHTYNVTINIKHSANEAAAVSYVQAFEEGAAIPSFDYASCASDATSVNGTFTELNYILNEGETAQFNHVNTNKYASAQDNQVSLTTDNDNSTLFEMVPCKNGYVLYSKAQNKLLKSVPVGSGSGLKYAASIDEIGVYYIGEQDSNRLRYWIGNNNEKSGNNFWNRFGGNDVIGGWNATDGGSQWFIVYNSENFVANRPNEAQFAAGETKLAYMQALCGEENADLKALAESFASFNIGRDNGTALLEQLNIASDNTFNGKQVSFTNKQHTNRKIVAKTFDNNEWKLGLVDEPVSWYSIWTIEANNGKFILKNEYTGKYVGSIPGSNNTRIPLVDNASEAYAYSWTITNNYISIYDATGEAERNAFHGVNWDGVVRWNNNASTDASWFIMSFISDNDKETIADALLAKVAIETENDGKIGYRFFPETFHNSLDALSANKTSMEAYAEVYEGLNNAEFYLPEDGKYYTIRGAHENHAAKFLTVDYENTVNIAADNQPADDRHKVIATAKADNIVPALWRFAVNGGEGNYANHYKIISANSGNAFRNAGWNNTLCTVPVEHENAGNYTLTNTDNRQFGGVNLRAEYGDLGHVSITGNGSDNNVKSYNGKTEGNNWIIEPVESFNLTLNASGYAVVNYPFAIKVDGCVPCVVGFFDGESLLTITALDPKDKSYVPANTPVILRGQPNAVVTVTIDYAAANAAALADDETTVGFRGVLAPATAENAFVLSGDKLVKTTDKISANSIYYPSTSAASEIALNADTSTGIEEISAIGGDDDSAARKGIYDLQGRRLSAPVKGINIINGKKVLVK